MKNIVFKLFFIALEFIYRKIILYVPFALFLFFGFDFSYKIIADPFSKEMGERIIGAFKIAASLAGLSFYAGYMTTEQKKKPVFYNNGEKLFHATVLFLISNILNRFLLTVETMQINVYFSSILIVLTSFLHLVFIIYALICAMFGITGLLKILHIETEKLLQKKNNLD
ncbi:MAG: hypothetical protein MRJ65_00065 [Candidatus Brocadiaceae bacterium]|nr:hypothetical protein [Candidatus Brocadiaceae bacterium]